MILTLTIISSLLLVGCITLAYQLWRLSNSIFSRAKYYVDSLYKSHSRVKAELKKRSDELSKKEIGLEKRYSKLDKDLLDKQKQLEAEYEEKRQQIEADAEAVLEQVIDKVDNALEEELASITAKNTLSFNCLCNDKPIACYIDLSEENTYRCPDCGTVYKVDITMNPVMVGKAISDEEYIALIRNRIEDEQ